MTLNRDQILAAGSTAPTDYVDVPEWGGKVLVRGLTGNERDTIEAGFVANKDNIEKGLRGMRARAVAWCTLDEDRNRVFGRDDIEWLGNQPAAVVNRIYDVITRLSGMDEKSVKKAESDFKSGQPGSSTSDWPDTSAAPSTSSSDGSAQLN